MVVAGSGRMSGISVKRQAMHQQKRKFTRADPTQTRILLKNYESQARPSATQFVDMSQETNLPVDWIKKWFLRKRKADGKNRALSPAVPTLVENEPPAHDGQTLGPAHSKFWSMDAFAAADSTSFSPSVGHIPKFHGHHTYGVPSGTRYDHMTDSRENTRERETSPPGVSTGTSFGYASPSDSVLTCDGVETAAPATCDLREALLGSDAFVGYFSPENEDTLGFPWESLNVDPGSPLLLPAASSPERSKYLDKLYGEEHSGFEGATDLGFDSTNYPVTLVSSPFYAVDDSESFLASRDLDLLSATSCNPIEDFELGALDSTIGYLGLYPGSPGFSDVLDEPPAFYESLHLPTHQDLTNWTDSCGLLGIDGCLGATPAAIEDETGSTSAPGPSLVNFDDGTCNLAAPKEGPEGFGGGDDDDAKDTVEGKDSDGKSWKDGLDTMLA